jgi:Uma2 family endonuclease
MTQPAPPAPQASIIYPQSDGKPMADNTKQLRWIVALYGNLAALFRENPDVFVGANQFWYPVEGHLEVVNAPDVYLAFGRPKGDRPSYKQWEEGDVPLTVVFEILSPDNSHAEMVAKFDFYEEYGVEEYYEYDPDTNLLVVYVRQGEMLRRVRPVAGFVSPRMGIRFETSGPGLVVLRPDSRRFLSFEELEAERLAAEQRAREEREHRLAAEHRAETAEHRAEQERQQRLASEQRTARLVELSRKARHQQACPEELAELERLEQEGPLSP